MISPEQLAELRKEYHLAPHGLSQQEWDGLLSTLSAALKIIKLSDKLLAKLGTPESPVAQAWEAEFLELESALQEFADWHKPCNQALEPFNEGTQTK